MDLRKIRAEKLQVDQLAGNTMKSVFTRHKKLIKCLLIRGSNVSLDETDRHRFQIFGAQMVISAYFRHSLEAMDGFRCALREAVHVRVSGWVQQALACPPLERDVAPRIGVATPSGRKSERHFSAD